jgi:hypothetical protein
MAIYREYDKELYKILPAESQSDFQGGLCSLESDYAD